MNIALISTGDYFLRNIPAELIGRGHQVSRFAPTPNVNLQRVAKLLAWADLAYYEWADNSVEVGLSIRPDKPTVVRMHRYEVYTGIVNKLDWTDVDLLMFNGYPTHIQRKFMEKTSTFPKRMAIVPDGIDLSLWKFADNRKFRPPWRFVIAGTLMHRKGVYQAIQMLADLGIDWRLTVVGKGGGEYLENCMEITKSLGVKRRVKFVGALKQEELADLFGKHHFVISNSTDECNHNTVREAMATGCYPLVNDWLGSDEAYPASNIFNSPAKFTSLIDDWVSSKRKKTIAKDQRAFVEEKYDMSVQTPLIVDEIEKVVI